jgi:pseudaminic acid biosynthesis-associated methylase
MTRQIGEAVTEDIYLEIGMRHLTEQEAFWEGDFGNEYTIRNTGSRLLSANIGVFSQMLGRVSKIESVLELGSNAGLNLIALRQLLPEARLSAVEINQNAAAQLKASLPDVDLHVKSILDFQPNDKWDLVFTKGVLIHIDPDMLPAVYDLMHWSASQYLLVAEYYNPTPTEVTYRGHTGKLFKRDFAGEILDRFSDLSLIDYGFAYNRDHNFPQDDLTWFLLGKGK